MNNKHILNKKKIALVSLVTTALIFSTTLSVFSNDSTKPAGEILTKDLSAEITQKTKEIETLKQANQEKEKEIEKAEALENQIKELTKKIEIVKEAQEKFTKANISLLEKQQEVEQAKEELKTLEAKKFVITEAEKLVQQANEKLEQKQKKEEEKATQEQTLETLREHKQAAQQKGQDTAEWDEKIQKAQEALLTLEQESNIIGDQQQLEMLKKQADEELERVKGENPTLEQDIAEKNKIINSVAEWEHEITEAQKVKQQHGELADLNRELESKRQEARSLPNPFLLKQEISSNNDKVEALNQEIVKLREEIAKKPQGDSENGNKPETDKTNEEKVKEFKKLHETVLALDFNTVKASHKESIQNALNDLEKHYKFSELSNEETKLKELYSKAQELEDELKYKDESIVYYNKHKNILDKQETDITLSDKEAINQAKQDFEKLPIGVQNVISDLKERIESFEAKIKSLEKKVDNTSTPVQPKPESKPEVKPEPKVINHNPNWEADLKKHNEFINKHNQETKKTLPNTGHINNHSILLASALLTLVAYKLYKKED